MTASAFTISAAQEPESAGLIQYVGALKLKPSPLRPDCRANQRIFLWRGVHTPPPSTIDHPVIQRLSDIASAASLQDSEAYGAGLRKFHIFCDIFNIPERARLPTSFPVIHSFALWAAADPDPADPAFADGTIFEPVAEKTVRTYLAAIRAWHIAQHWPPPLSDDDHAAINWSLRGLRNIQGEKRKCPPRPPVTPRMLMALRNTLDLTDSFDACIWAAATCAFFGLMRFGELSVRSQAAFSPQLHLAREHALFDHDKAGSARVKLLLPRAKTSEPGKPQEIVIVDQSGPLSPIEALRNHAAVNPASARDPLFSWYDRKGQIRPLTRKPAIDRINSILAAWGWGTSFGHSFRIGGASFLLAQGVSPEIVRLQGRWRSLAYETYIRAFEEIASQHISNLPGLPEQ
jgi:hypothetical protein